MTRAPQLFGNLDSTSARTDRLSAGRETRRQPNGPDFRDTLSRVAEPRKQDDANKPAEPDATDVESKSAEPETVEKKPAATETRKTKEKSTREKDDSSETDAVDADSSQPVDKAKAEPASDATDDDASDEAVNDTADGTKPAATDGKSADDLNTELAALGTPDTATTNANAPAKSPKSDARDGEAKSNQAATAEKTVEAAGGIQLPEELAKTAEDATDEQPVPEAAVKAVRSKRALRANNVEVAEAQTETAEADVNVAQGAADAPDASSDLSVDPTAAESIFTTAAAKSGSPDTGNVASDLAANVGAFAAKLDAHLQARDSTAAAPTPATAEARFVEANHPKLVGGITGQLLPNGGSMQLRLDPPHLGPLQVSVHMKDGIITASFETQNDDATRLLSHSLSQLKSALESQGVTVDKLQVQQAPKDQQSDNNPNDPRQQQANRDLADQQQQNRQRQEMLKRMWSRLNGDPLDLVA